MSSTATTACTTAQRRRRSFGSVASPAIVALDIDSEERRKERPRCCLQYLLLYVAVVAVLGSNSRHILGMDRADNVNLARVTLKDGANAVDRGDVEPLESFFDCSRDGSKCKSFNPGEFFKHYYNSTTDGARGSGKDVAGSNEGYLQWRREIGLENANLPALDSLSWWVGAHSDGDDSPGSMQRYWIQSHVNNLPRNLTYIHVHKCGGTSIQGALYRRARRIRDMDRENQVHAEGQLDKHAPMVFHADVRTYKHSFGGGRKAKKEFWDHQRLGHIRAIEESQKKRTSESNAHPIFTVVRDPIERFLSAVQQVMHYNAEFRSKCLREPSKSLLSSLTSQQKREENEAKLRRETIHCAVAYNMDETQYGRDVHLVPMASHFRLLEALSVSVFDMGDIESVLHYLGNDPAKKGSKTTHMRDRSNVNYATSSTLARLSSKDCDDEMIRRICKLYHVDVELRRWLGFGGEAVERCNG